MNRKQPSIKTDSKSTTKRKIKAELDDDFTNINLVNNVIPNKVHVKYKTPKQKAFADLIKENEIVICSGPAGCGKSWLSIGTGLELIQDPNSNFKTLIIVNPAVEAEEKLGFIPGTVKDKLLPFVASSIDILDKLVGTKNRIMMEERGILKVEALAYIRGKTIDNAILVMEEAQNMSPGQMKTLITRIGSNSKFIISGDLDQSDKYSDFKCSGLYDAINKFKKVSEVKMFQFDINDIVRNPIITKLLKCYEVIEPKKMEKPTPTMVRTIPESNEPKSKIENKVVYDKQNTLKAFLKRTFKW